MRALPVVKDCCCGCSLEVGSKIIAWLEIVVGVLIIIAGIVVAVRGSSENSEHPSGGKSAVSEFVSGILSIIFGVFLLKAIQKKRPDHINVWVIFSLVVIVLYIIGAIITVFILVVELSAFLVGLLAFIIGAIHIALTFYTIVVVSSFRKEIVASRNIGV